jgi:hypothetical protein
MTPGNTPGSSPVSKPDVTLSEKDETLLEALFESEAAFASACKKAGLSLLAAAKWIELPRIEAAIAQIKRMRQTQQDLAIQQQRTLGIESLAKLLCCSEPVKPETIRKAAMALLQLTVTPKKAPSPEVKQDKGMGVLGLADLLFPAGLPPELDPSVSKRAGTAGAMPELSGRRPGRGVEGSGNNHAPRGGAGGMAEEKENAAVVRLESAKAPPRGSDACQR